MFGPAPPRRSAASVSFQFAIVFIAAYANSAGASWPFSFGHLVGAPIWWLQCLALVALLWALHSCTSSKQAAVTGLVFATAWLCATFWWLYVSMHTFAGLNAALTVLAIVALAMALGAYYAIACGLYWRLRQRGPWPSTFAFAALWTMAEMARGTWLTGFGWGAIGYAHADGPLAAWIPWVGSYGVGFLAAWVSAAGLAVMHGGWAMRLVLVLLLAVVPAFGLWVPGILPVWSTPAGSLSVTLLQGNIPQDEKFQSGSGVPLALGWYGDQLNRSNTDLVVAPETAIPLLPQELPDDYWAALKTRFANGEQAALIGVPLGNMAEGYTNSVVGIAPNQQQVWRYDKHHLVPFGEFIPPLFKWFTRMMNIPLGDFNRGAVGQESFNWKDQRLAANICYEDLFGEELGVRFVDPARAPTIFVNVSNIGWFGDTVAIDQHLQISRMRALEFERPMVRATNTGATVIIDHTGAVVQSLPRYTRGALVGTVQGRSGTTPFAWWVGRLGLWPLWSLSIAIVFVAVRARSTRAD
jgi:apolipoprotein N-acyltransferase